jgi:hypothetical protein
MRRTATLLTAMCAASFAFAGEPLSMREYEERCASYYARQYDVSPALVRAVIQVESAWQPGVVSSKGAMGLMQLMPATAEHFGVTKHPVGAGNGRRTPAQDHQSYHDEKIENPRAKDGVCRDQFVRACQCEHGCPRSLHKHRKGRGSKPWMCRCKPAEE